MHISHTSRPHFKFQLVVLYTVECVLHTLTLTSRTHKHNTHHTHTHPHIHPHTHTHTQGCVGALTDFLEDNLLVVAAVGIAFVVGEVGNLPVQKLSKK